MFFFPMLSCGNGNVVEDYKAPIVDSTEYYPISKSSAITTYDGYNLVWNDEFNMDGRPGKDWTYEKGFIRNRELQWYQSDNASVKDGCLIIEGRKENILNASYDANSADWRFNRQYANYTSSCLTTQGHREFKYGRFVVRAKIPVASGAWPAIWLMGNKWEWPMNGEIDMMEYYIRDGIPSILANACWSSEKQWNAIWDESVTPYSHFIAKDSNWARKFHVWRMDWDKNYMKLYLDNELLNEVDLSKTKNQGYNYNTENPFSNDISGFGDYILLNLAIGSNGGTPDKNAFPMKYLIDYVRVYQFK